MRWIWRVTVVYPVLIASVSILWLFSPKPVDKKDYCGIYASINAHMGFVVNCDASSYTSPAASPGKLLGRNEVRQSRPLYVLLGTLAGYPLGRAAALVRPSLDPRVPYHIAFAIVNFILLYGTVLLFDRLMSRAGAEPHIVVPLAIFFIANDVTKAFIWTAHQQMFSLLTPLVALACFIRIAWGPALSRGRLALLALALGGLLLVYGNFLVLLPTLLVADFGAGRRTGGRGLTDAVSRTVLSTTAFLLPTLLWILIVTWSAGSYYNHEMVVYRQLVWVLDAVRSGPLTLFDQFLRNTRAYAATFVSIELLPLAASVVLVLLGTQLLARPEHPEPSADPGAGSRILQERGCRVVFGAFFLFLWILGYYRTRLTYSLVPPALCLGALELSRIAAGNRVVLNRMCWSLASAGGLWTAYHVVKYGPFG